jgi:hypothetical protein
VTRNQRFVINVASVLYAVLPTQKHSPEWGADGTIGKAIGKPDSPAGKLIKIWSYNLLITIASQHVKSLLVGKYKYQVWRFFYLVARWQHHSTCRHSNTQIERYFHCFTILTLMPLL